MADPTDSYPEDATLGARSKRNGAGTGRGDGEGDGDGEKQIREVLDVHGDDLAAALDRLDDAADVVETAILILASADAEEIDHLTESLGNLVEAADGLSTEEAAALATSVGENGEYLSDTVDTLLEFQQEGRLDDFATIAGAFSESLSPEEVEELASMLEENGAETVEALDVVLDLHREGQLDDLVDLAKVVSTLEIDADTAAGMNTFLGAVGEAQRESEPVGLFGFISGMRSRDARAGLGYLLALLKAQGRRVRER
jgi:uncharacterized protein YjgD (DUF1641 family)